MSCAWRDSFFCEVGACLKTVGLHTIFLQRCIVSDQTLSVIATHSAATLQRLVLFETSSYDRTIEGLYTASGVRSILQSCHQLKHLEMGGGFQWNQKERITHEAWNSTGVVCCGLETLCLGNQQTDDASVTAIMTLFPDLQVVAITCMNHREHVLGFSSLLALAGLPQLRHLDLRRMDRALCLSKSCIQALAPALGRIESFSAEIRENERDAYESLFRRLCPSPHLTDLWLNVPLWVRFPGGCLSLDSDTPLMPNWLADEPTEMQYPYRPEDLWEDSE